MCRMEKKLKQTPYIVAFLDFLGASEKMEMSGESDVFLQQIYRIYNIAIGELKLVKKIGLLDLDVKIFSDNILVVQKIRNRDNPIPEFVEVQSFCRLFQSYAFEQGLLVRGAITKGAFFINEIFVYGAALSKAYRMESHHAKYPRIIVDPCIFSLGNIPEFLLAENSQNGVCIKCDPHNTYYLDPFSFMHEHFTQNDFNNLLLKVKEIIVSGYAESYPKNSTVSEKYIWLAKAFNEFCDRKDLIEHKVLTSVVEVQ